MRKFGDHGLERGAYVGASGASLDHQQSTTPDVGQSKQDSHSYMRGLMLVILPFEPVGMYYYVYFVA